MSDEMTKRINKKIEAQAEAIFEQVLIEAEKITDPYRRLEFMKNAKQNLFPSKSAEISHDIPYAKYFDKVLLFPIDLDPVIFSAKAYHYRDVPSLIHEILKNDKTASKIHGSKEQSDPISTGPAIVTEVMAPIQGMPNIPEIGLNGSEVEKTTGVLTRTQIIDTWNKINDAGKMIGFWHYEIIKNLLKAYAWVEEYYLHFKSYEFLMLLFEISTIIMDFNSHDTISSLKREQIQLLGLRKVMFIFQQVNQLVNKVKPKGVTNLPAPHAEILTQIEDVFAVQSNLLLSQVPRTPAVIPKPTKKEESATTKALKDQIDGLLKDYDETPAWMAPLICDRMMAQIIGNRMRQMHQATIQTQIDDLKDNLAEKLAKEAEAEEAKKITLDTASLDTDPSSVSSAAKEIVNFAMIQDRILDLITTCLKQISSMQYAGNQISYNIFSKRFGEIARDDSQELWEKSSALNQETHLEIPRLFLQYTIRCSSFFQGYATAPAHNATFLFPAETRQIRTSITSSTKEERTKSQSIFDSATKQIKDELTTETNYQNSKSTEDTTTDNDYFSSDRMDGIHFEGRGSAKGVVKKVVGLELELSGGTQTVSNQAKGGDNSITSAVNDATTNMENVLSNHLEDSGSKRESTILEAQTTTTETTTQEGTECSWVNPNMDRVTGLYFSNLLQVMNNIFHVHEISLIFSNGYDFAEWSIDSLQSNLPPYFLNASEIEDMAIFASKVKKLQDGTLSPTYLTEYKSSLQAKIDYFWKILPSVATFTDYKGRNLSMIELDLATNTPHLKRSPYRELVQKYNTEMQGKPEDIFDVMFENLDKGISGILIKRGITTLKTSSLMADAIPSPTDCLVGKSREKVENQIEMQKQRIETVRKQNEIITKGLSLLEKIDASPDSAAKIDAYFKFFTETGSAIQKNAVLLMGNNKKDPKDPNQNLLVN